ncbi:hypothetical protein MPSEU_000524400 [Mayamaea pseudoterrestris]|nr:hypothetical protein MPSEU_000524400 [Mayamaea pseudoterrestris]
MYHYKRQAPLPLYIKDKTGLLIVVVIEFSPSCHRKVKALQGEQSTTKAAASKCSMERVLVVILEPSWLQANPHGAAVGTISNSKLQNICLKSSGKQMDHYSARNHCHYYIKDWTRVDYYI